MGVGPEADDLVFQRPTHGRDRAFEIADGVVGTFQQGRKGGSFWNIILNRKWEPTARTGTA